MESKWTAQTLHLRLKASMEPWHFSHGEDQRDHVVAQDRHASMEPWHFSHGELQGRPFGAGRTPASMEPWHFSHGEVSKQRRLRTRGIRFNGAMAF